MTTRKIGRNAEDADSGSRTMRLNFRATSEEDARIRLAASLVEKNISEFIIESTQSAADRILADRNSFQVNSKLWVQFNEALDRPAIFKPRLGELIAASETFFD